MTATQANGFMIQRYDLQGAADVLRHEGLVLLPTDALWCVACLASDPVAIERLRRLLPPSAEHPYEFLFSSLDMLKAYAPQLHPRLETLLSFHRRPLTVLTPAHPQCYAPALADRRHMAARVVHDRYCKALIQQLDGPILTAFARKPDTPMPSHVGRVRSDIISAVDYVARYRPREVFSQHPAVLVQVSADDELNFVRE